MDKDLVSVIVPIHNVERYLRQCLDSIVNQTYKHLEIILVNDASTDHSKEICEEYKNKDDRVKLINLFTNAGISEARNIGVENAAKGGYFAFIDSDDWIEATYIEKMYHQAVKNDADISMVKYNRFLEETGEYLLFGTSDNVEILDTESYLERLFQGLDDTFVTVWGKLYKKELFCINDKIKLSFPLRKVTQDQLVSCYLAIKSNKIVYIDEPLYIYRKRGDSVSNKVLSDKHILDDLSLQEERLIHLLLAGYPIDSALNFYKQRFYDYFNYLKENNKSSSPAYKELIKRLDIIDRKS